MGVLLWAISAIAELPAQDTRFEDPASLVPLLAPTAEFRRLANLRPAEELEGARAGAYRDLDAGEHPDAAAIARERRPRSTGSVALPRLGPRRHRHLSAAQAGGVSPGRRPA